MVSSKWGDLFLYDETSVTAFRWGVDRVSGRNGNQVNVYAGDVAGSLPSDSRFHSVVSVNSQQYLVHRVVWELLNGTIEDGSRIDHKDGDGRNNRIDNLRLVTHAVNMRNCKKRVDNKSGVSGICRFTNRHGTESISAQWNDLNGKQRTKTFSTVKYGSDEAFRLACEYRAAMLAELNRQGAGYTEDHGKR